MAFLTAEWKNLLLINFVVDPEVLEDHIPPKTELDLWEGRCYLSLIGFMFNKTQVLGIPIPWHQQFEEVNLRFYVKHKHLQEWRHGVVFLKEIVPKPLISFIANSLYRENYITRRMRHHFAVDNHIEVEYGWNDGSQWQSISAIVDNSTHEIAEGSETEFITKHFWGYANGSSKNSYEYEVQRPAWKAHPVLSSDISVDFGSTYGRGFAFLDSQNPQSVMFANGSTISVSNKRKL